MASIRALDLISKKWASVTPARAAEYEKGVMNPTRDYARGATEANAAWKAGTTAAIAGDRFVAGVARAGTAKWQDRSVKLGTQRYGPGVQVAEPDYAAGFAPYREAIASATLPPRGPRRSPQNLARVAAIVSAISARKEALLKGGR